MDAFGNNGGDIQNQQQQQQLQNQQQQQQQQLQQQIQQQQLQQQQSQQLMNGTGAAPGHIIYTLAPPNAAMTNPAMAPFTMLNAPTIQVPLLAPGGLTPSQPSSFVPRMPPKFKKAPGAPKRFKSAFIIFSASKHRELKEEFSKEGRSEKTTDIAKLVSEAWRQLGPEDKEVWEQLARKDKARYEMEKAHYKGPWKVPAHRRRPKDPTAPKRNKRRAGLKRENPDATNSDLSKMLAQNWREAADDVRRKYMEEESALRVQYKLEMAKWKEKDAEKKRDERLEREAAAMKAAEERSAELAAMPPVAPPVPISMGQNPQDMSANGVNMAGFFNPYAAMAGQMQGLGAFPGVPQQQQQLPQQQQVQQVPQQQVQQQQPQQQQLQGVDPNQQYANFMVAGNAFNPQQFANPAQQQQLISQLVNQQLKYPPAMAMYQGMPRQGLMNGFPMSPNQPFMQPMQQNQQQQQQPMQQNQQQQPTMQQNQQQQPTMQQNQQQQPMQQNQQPKPMQQQQNIQQQNQQLQQQMMQQQQAQNQQFLQQQQALVMQQQQQPQQQLHLVESPEDPNNGNPSPAQGFSMAFPQIGEAAQDSQQQQQAMSTQQQQQAMIAQAQQLQQMFMQPQMMAQQVQFAVPRQQQMLGQPSVQDMSNSVKEDDI